MSWRETTLGECARFLSGGTPRKAVAEYWNGDIPWVGSGEMSESFIWDTALRVTREGAQDGSRLVPENTVLVVVRGMSLAKDFRISLTMREMTFNQDVKALVCTEGITPRFLFYALKARKDHIRDLATDASHGTKKLETDQLKAVVIKVPETVEEQGKVTSILSAYDDLIENNRRRIGLLEQAARLLYREWFVHLRFPGHETAKIVNGLPEGWSRCIVEDLLVLQRGFDLPVGDRKEGEVPVYGSTGIVGYHNEPKVPAPAIITGRSGSLGQVAISDTPCWPLNTALWVKELKGIPATLGYFLLVSLELEKYNGGASVPTLDRKVVHRLPAVRPSSEVVEQFDAIASKSFQTIAKLRTHNQQLTRARDLLLPRLMDGRIPV